MKPQTFKLEDIEEALETNTGFCLACGEERECTEPDASGYDCNHCNNNMVEGAANILLMGLAY